MGKFSTFYFSLWKNMPTLMLCLFFPFKRREQTAMVEYILSTTTLVLRNGKTPEVKGKKLPVTSI